MRKATRGYRVNTTIKFDFGKKLSDEEILERKNLKEETNIKFKEWNEKRIQRMKSETTGSSAQRTFSENKSKLI